MTVYLLILPVMNNYDLLLNFVVLLIILELFLGLLYIMCWKRWHCTFAGNCDKCWLIYSIVCQQTDQYTVLGGSHEQCCGCLLVEMLSECSCSGNAPEWFSVEADAACHTISTAHWEGNCTDFSLVFFYIMVSHRMFTVDLNVFSTLPVMENVWLLPENEPR